jgi:hypothetical protein
MKWLLQDGVKGKKHGEWAHPIAVYVTHYAVVVATIFYAHDVIVPSRAGCLNDESVEYQAYRHRQQTCAIFSGIYGVLQLFCRLTTTPTEKNCVLYEGTWLCNSTLLVGSLGLWFQRPLITAAFCLTVGIDQLLWYLDITGWALTGRFPVGVAKYLTWPSTTWVTYITCTHHLWTMPLFLYYAAVPLQPMALWLSCVLMVLHVSLSRLMTPPRVGDKYLNVNLSHELWKDINFSMLQITYDNPPAVLYMVRLLVRWQGFNVIVYLVLSTAMRFVLGNGATQRLC